MFYRFHCQMKKMLANSRPGWTRRGACEGEGIRPDVFIPMRLAPDQFAFVQQVQAACDTAKLSAVRLTTREAPAHPDTEKTLSELRTRIRSVIGYLDGISEPDYAAAATASSRPRAGKARS